MSNRCRDPEFVWIAIRLGELDQLKASAAGHDWTALNPRTHVTPLHSLLSEATNASDAMFETYLKIAQWLVEQGADPLQPAGKDCKIMIQRGIVNVQESDTSRVDYTGRSVTTCTMLLKKAILEKKQQSQGMYDYSHLIPRLDRLLQVFRTPRASRNVIPVDEAVVELWDRVLRTKGDVSFICKDEDVVTGHSAILGEASPVLSAMLKSNRFKEGLDQQIDIPDVSAEALRLFLDLVYCGSSPEEISDATTAIAALDIAHRWQVMHVVDMVARKLKSLINEETFETICEHAARKDIQSLMQSCIKFAEASETVSRRVAEESYCGIVVSCLRPHVGRSDGGTCAKRKRVLF